MGFSFESKGDFNGLEKFLRSSTTNNSIGRQLAKFGQQGVKALASATPVDSSKTAASWSFEVKSSKGSHSIIWSNSHVEDGVPIAIILQYGHGTGTGGYVQGRDYINPAMKPVFDKIETDVWKAVTSA
jgi:hypothetical protein